MRRPLCAAGVVYLTVLFIIQCLSPVKPAGICILSGTGQQAGTEENAADAGRSRASESEIMDSSGEKRAVTVKGTVTSREYRTYSGIRTLVIYIKTDSVISSSDHQDNLLFSVTDHRSGKNSKSDNNVQKVSAGSTSRGGHYVIACTMDKPVPPKTGSKVLVRGTLSLYDQATNPGEFDMRRYEQTVGVDGRIDKAVIIASGREYDVIKEYLAGFRDRAAQILSRLFGEHDGGILAAMVLGDKEGLDAETKTMYQRNGIIHILAISGLHISIIGLGLFRLLKKCRVPVPAAASVSVIFMYMYGIMCGMASSAERAIVMFALGMLAKVIGRTYDLLTALCIAALMIVTEQPMYLQYSGFLFSFGAVLAIGLFLPAAGEVYMDENRKKTKNGRIRKLRAALLSGIVIALVTLPVHLYFYYQFPLFSLLLNLAVIPLMTFVMAGTLAGLGLSLMFYPLGLITVPPVHLILGIYEAGCRLGDSLPVNRIVTGQPHGGQILAFYLVICTVFGLHRYIPKHIFTMFLLTAACILVIRADSGLEMTFIDVGQGDGTYITDNRGLDILVDGGSSTKKKVGQYVLEPFLKSQGAGHLDAVFITHLDSDHYNGILELIELSDEGGIGIDEIVLNSAVYGAGGEKMDELKALAEKHRIKVVRISAGMKFGKGRLDISCLYPSQGTAADADDTNETSTVLFLEYGGFTALLTGDLQGSGETELDSVLAGERFRGRRITVLKAAHHGSRNSTFEPFLSETRPEAAVLSAGRGNRYGHPHRELLLRLDRAGTRAMCTIDCGAVTVRVNQGGRAEITGFVKQEPAARH